MLDQQNDYGLTSLGLAVLSGWMEGVDLLLEAGANPELRYFRTGETPLEFAVQDRKPEMVVRLLAAGADPDAANYWGLTPRIKLPRSGLPPLFDGIPEREIRFPTPRIQNAEHLADNHYPNFKIPKRAEREAMQVGRCVDSYVYGPKSAAKQDTVKVRIVARTEEGSRIRYSGEVETPLERTHLAPGTTTVEFGPENIATVYMLRPSRKRKKA